MTYIKRTLDITSSLSRKSQFLFGPHRVGKASWVENELEGVVCRFNLQDHSLYRKLSLDPSYLSRMIRENGISEGLVVIDEIQLLPILLNEVHNLIETASLRFLLTGSSARKLRAQGVNLLGGRAGWKEMYPFVWPEIKEEVSLERIFFSGLNPSAFLSSNPDEELGDFLRLYLTQEIQMEGLVRQLPEFTRFLEVAALSNTEIINCTNISREIGVSATAVSSWFQILYDTLIGFEVPAFRKTKKRKTFSTSKYYFFDVGVVRSILELGRVAENSTEFGKSFEAYIACELRAFLGYRLGYYDMDRRLCYWRTTSGFEVDFILNGKIAIETKTTKHYTERDLKGLRALKEEGICERYILVCREELPLLTDDGIEVLPWQYFLDSLWSRKYL